MNVLFLMADELSWWAMGHRSAHIHTPNLDALAARSVSFEAAYTPSPICVPARAAIATGKHVHEVRCWSSAEPYTGEVPSWGHALQRAGHAPVSIGKLHYQSRAAQTGFAEQIEPVHVVDGVGWVQALLRRPIAPNLTAGSLAEEIGPGETGYTAFDRRVTACAVDWLGAPERRQAPWCAFVSWLAPHFPLIAPPQDFARYDPKDHESAAEPVPDHPILKEIAEYFEHDRYFTPETRGIGRAGYFGLCTHLDRQVGRVLEALRASGQEDETLILFTSDHGEMLGEKGFWTKSTMYDSAARVPLMMAGPGVVPGQWHDPVSLIDIAPTICAAMGAPCEGFSGVDLCNPQPGRAVISEYHDGGCSAGITMVRWDHWKLVYYAEGHPAQLFDLAADPCETLDLAQLRGDIVEEGVARLCRIMDPEAVNRRAHRDQAARIEVLGGEVAVRSRPTFDYTPADSS